MPEVVQFAQIGGALASVGLLLVAIWKLPEFSEQQKLHTHQLELQTRQLELQIEQQKLQTRQLELQTELQRDRFDQEKKWETTKICQKFSIDPEITGCLRTIAQHVTESGHGAHRDYSDVANHADSRIAARLLLNYFDSIAIGVEQGFYIEDIVADQFKDVVLKMLYEVYVQGTNGSHRGLSWTATKRELIAPDGHFEALRKLYTRWYPVTPPRSTSYKVTSTTSS
ncbi:MAG: hypothetical protein MN733_38310 [Nitrososphaera sp.]|nr:hypothetical protein [Nitrososphaera sp.]